MKVLYVALALFASISASYAQEYTPSKVQLDAKYGFRDLKFETDTAHVSGRKLIERSKDGLTTYYVRPADKLEIGKGKVESITYCFYRGKLYMVMIPIQGAANMTAVLSALRELYGPEFATPESWGWRGELVHALLSKSGPGAGLTITSRIISQQRREEKEAAKRAASGL